MAVEILSHPDALEKILLLGMSERIWGEVDPKTAGVFTRLYGNLSPLHLEVEIQIVLEVRARLKEWKGQSLFMERRQYGLAHAISSKTIYSLPQDYPPMLAMTLSALVITKIGPLIREADPRFGWKVLAGLNSNSDFPRCPLFDPPFLKLPDPHGEHPFDSCLLCGAKFWRGQEVRWGGGDLLWVCNACSSGAQMEVNLTPPGVDL